MRILGIDPGIGRMGWGIIEVQKAKLRAQSFGCLETKSSQDTAIRLEELYTFVREIIATDKPDVLAIEELFFNTNAKTAFVVGQARGVVLLVAAQAKLPIAIYTPLQVKIAVTGYGRAEKKQIGEMVKRLLQLSTIPKPDDTADALAVALTHAFSAKLERKVRL